MAGLWLGSAQCFKVVKGRSQTVLLLFWECIHLFSSESMWQHLNIKEPFFPKSLSKQPQRRKHPSGGEYFLQALYAPLTYSTNGCYGEIHQPLGQVRSSTGLLEKLAIRCSCSRVCCLLRFLFWSCSGTQHWWRPESNPYCGSFSESLQENINNIYIVLC